MGTLSPNFCRKVADVGRQKRIEVLDSPVTGGSMKAETGELGVMLGGDKALIEKYRSLLETMGAIPYCGNLGSGQVLKRASNLLVESLNAGHSNSWVIQNWDFIKSINIDPPSPHHVLGAKYLDYALKIGHETGQPCQVTATTGERAAVGVLKPPEKQIPLFSTPTPLPSRVSQ
jgi:hypothetical protein